MALTSFIHIIYIAYIYLHILDTTMGCVPQCQNASTGKCIFDKFTSFLPQPNMCLLLQQVLAVAVAS
jgi:hypothetical protein